MTRKKQAFFCLNNFIMKHLEGIRDCELYQKLRFNTLVLVKNSIRSKVKLNKVNFLRQN